ncbi:hypothetical protein A6U87_20960 [Rhizobium sp. AC44/96]|nr:hypothetical protein A6U87_20960 [Rhizobium sp. AC44/96]
MDMSWLKLDPARSSMSEPEFRLAVQDHFLKLFLPHRDSFDWDVAAFYRSRDERPIYYFSPGAADLLTRFGEFPYDSCHRPDSSTVDLQVGSSLAADTAWVKLPDETRPYPKLDEELDEDETGYWQQVIASGGKHGPNNGGPA